MKNIIILAVVLLVALYCIIAEVIWKLKDRIFRRRLITGVLIVALLASQTDIMSLFMKTDAETAHAAEAENSEMITVSAFAELPDDIIEQTVPIGTELSELALPNALEAVCVKNDSNTEPDTDENIEGQSHGGNDTGVKTLEADLQEGQADSDTSEASQETIIIENITWQSEPEYDGNVEGEYIFTVVLPDEYTLTDRANVPQITVTVDETDNIALLSNDGIMLLASNRPPLSVGGGTVDNPYKISSEADLKTLATFVNAGTNAGAGTDNSCSGMYFELTKDITLSGTWTPIGKEVGVNNNSFSGIFDGKNHTISGLNITVSQGQQGLFGVVKEGEIKNLNVKGTITGTSKNYYSVGGVVGYNDLGIIENCSFSGTISVKGDKAGGIAGYNSGNAKGTMGIIRNCTASGAVTGTQYVGGILGHNVTGTVQNCYNNCTVEGTYAVGGIVGYNAQTSIVSNSYNTDKGNVECNGDNSYGSRVGGIAGMNSASTINNCYNEGSVTGNLDNVGGIAGMNSSDSTINNCYNEGSVTGNLDYVGGVVGYNNATATVQNCYNRGTVTGSGDKVGGVIGDSTATNSYYLNTCGAAGTGESKTSAQFTSGEVTWLLQNGQSDFVWGQTLNSNNYPLLVTFTSSAKRVWKVAFMDGSTERAAKYVNDGNTITEPTDVINDGYTAEWYTAQNGGGSKYNFSSAVKADLTLYVNWVENKCTVTFDANGGSVTPTTKEYKIGETYVTLPIPTRTGYTFDAWYTTATGGTKITATSIVSKDVTRLYAHWKANEYNITYKDQGDATFSGTHASGYPTKHTYGTATTLKSASKTGYTFGGWYTESNCTGSAITSLGATDHTSTITLYAKWTANQYTVSFDSAGGSSVPSIEVTYDSPYGELPTPTRTGHTFKGWYPRANGSGTEVTSTTKVATDSNHTLYAYWTGNLYEVTLKYQDGKTDDKKITVTYGSTYGSNLPSEPSRAGYHFVGWFTAAEDGVEVKSDTEVTTVQDHTLYARWIDDIAPVIGELTYNYSTKNVAGYVIGNKNLTITVPVTELGSGADEIEYTASAVKGTSKSGTAAIEADGTAKFNVDADFEGSIEITCTDKEGNKSSKTVKVILEGNEPTVSFKIAGIVVSGETDYYDVAPAVDVDVIDDMNNAISGGIASVTYQVDGSSEQSVTEDFTTTIREQYSFTIPASEIPTGVNDITVKVEDNAGNTATAMLTVKVKGAEKTPEAKLDEVHVTLTDLVPGAEYDITYKDADGNPHTDKVEADESGKLDIKNDWTGGEIEIVKKGNGTDTVDSQPQKLDIPEREPGISGTPTVTGESLKGANDGKIGGLNPEEEYEVSTDGGNTWEKKTADSDGELKPLAPGGYEVRRPGGDDTLPSKSVHVDIEESNFTQEKTPEAKLDEVHVTLTDLVPGAEYDITYKGADGNLHTEKVEADENGNLDIKDDWTGGEIEIVKKGNGTDTVDSKPQKLDIPEREPGISGTPTVTGESLKGANDGKIGGLNPEEEYEVSTDGGNTWEKKTADSDGELKPLAPGGYEVRRPAGDGTLPSKSVHVDIEESNITKEETPKAKLDEVHVTITDLVPGAEYDITYKGADGNLHTEKVKADENGNLDIKDDWTGREIEIVKKGNGTDTVDSQPQKLDIPERETAPESLTTTDESLKGANDGKIGGLNPGEAYEISPDGGNTWEKKTADSDGELKPLAPGGYEVRRPAGDDTLPSKSVHVDIEESNIIKEETPNASVDRQNGKIQGLVPEAEYDITYTGKDGTPHTDKVKADENGNFDIKDDWIDSEIEIVKKGTGTDIIDSDKQTLHIPVKEKKPDPKTTKVSAKGKSNGKITNLEPNETYEISTDGGKTWETKTADSNGEITGLPAGDYKIRTKAKDDANGGTLSSDAADCKIGTKSSSNSGGGSSGSGGDDNGGGQPDNDGGSDQTDNTPPGTVPPPTGTPADTKTPETKTPETKTPPTDTPKPEESGEPEQGAKPDTKPSGETTDPTAPTETENDAAAITGDSIATGTIEAAQDTTTTLTVGEGSVRVIVDGGEYKYTAGVADTVAVANAVLTPEQIQLVNNGEKIEIRVDVKDISEQVSKEDKNIIENGLAAEGREEELTLGAYIDISMYIRIGDGDWNAITQSGEAIDVVIGIPDELQSGGRTFYIARCHEGQYALLDDMDTEVETITIRTALFSTYAIVYSQAGTAGSKCNLCHICPTFLGICCFVWLAIITAAVIVVILIVSKRRKKEI